AKTQLQAKNGQPRAKTKPRDRHRSAKIQFAAYTCRAVTEFCKRLPGLELLPERIAGGGLVAGLLIARSAFRRVRPSLKIERAS
ncbi:MAG TPA: hypothetical protein VHX20_16640, partial [Terracidiphilus sp.]|nr:hypothetical protein [Terracidiphilus sp.]